MSGVGRGWLKFLRSPNREARKPVVTVVKPARHAACLGLRAAHRPLARGDLMQRPSCLIALLAAVACSSSKPATVQDSGNADAGGNVDLSEPDGVADSADA